MQIAAAEGKLGQQNQPPDPTKMVEAQAKQAETQQKLQHNEQAQARQEQQAQMQHALQARQAAGQEQRATEAHQQALQVKAAQTRGQESRAERAQAHQMALAAQRAEREAKAAWKVDKQPAKAADKGKK